MHIVIGGVMMNLDGCRVARINKDKNFDGQFYFGVKTTGIFCIPSCPSPTAKEENVVYFNDVDSAIKEGYRPCLRCRPNKNIKEKDGFMDIELINISLDMIKSGVYNINNLAKKLYISERYLRKLYNIHIGISPLKVIQLHKALIAMESIGNEKTITDTGYKAGFSSIKQFNTVFKKVFGCTPTKAKEYGGQKTLGKIIIEINHDETFVFKEILDFLRIRRIEGVEVVESDCYKRSYRFGSKKGYFSIRQKDDTKLALTIYTHDIKVIPMIYTKVRKMFDLDTDFTYINSMFKNDELLSKGMDLDHVPRLPVAFDTFEFLIRAILGQQITVKAATTLTRRIVERANICCEGNYHDEIKFFFPNLKELTWTDISGLGITNRRQETIKRVLQGLNDGVFTIDKDQSYERFLKEFISIKGIGNWTVDYVAMRGLGMVDSFPSKDLGVIKAISKEEKLPDKEILNIAEKWRPYRAYATLCLWNSLRKKES